MKATLSLALLAAVALAEDKPCTLHDSGRYYDLNPLLGNSDYELTTGASPSHPIWLNICRSVKTEIFGLKDVPEAEVAGFVRQAHGDFAIGKLNTTFTVVDSQPRLIFSGGSKCKPTPDGTPGDVRASTIISFTCDSGVYGRGEPKLVTYLPPGDDEVACAFVFEWKTPYACPTSDSGILWRIVVGLVVTLLVLLMTYTVLGTLYNRFVLQLRGADQIPQFSMESMRYHAREAIDWIKDILAGWNIGQGSGGRGGGGGARMPYGGLGGGPINPVSHQTQVQAELGQQGEYDAPIGAGGGGFVRPTRNASSTPSPAPNRRGEINPVSHQSQVESGQTYQSPPMPGRAFGSHQSSPNPGRAFASHQSQFSSSLSQSQSFSPSPPQKDPQSLSQPQTPQQPTHPQTPQTAQTPQTPARPFQLGEDEEEEEEEGEEMTTPRNSESAAAMRGRELDDGGVIRL